MQKSSTFTRAVNTFSRLYASASVRRAARLAVMASAVALAPSLAHATSTDLLSPQAATVKSTFGSGSTLVTWFYISEVVISLMLFIKTRSPLVFIGLIFVIIFTRVAFGIIG